MLQIIQKTYEGALLTTPASGVVALFALNGGTIKNVRVKVDAANTAGATRFNLSKNGTDLFATELTVAQNQTVISLTGLNIAVSRFDRLILNLETVSTGGVTAPIALQIESDELDLISQADVYDAVKAIVQAGSNVTRTPDDTGKTLTFAGLSDEQIQDKIAAFLVAGTNITLSYDDTANTLTISASGGGGGTLDGDVTGDAESNTVSRLSGRDLFIPDPTGVLSDNFSGAEIDADKWDIVSGGSGVTVAINSSALRFDFASSSTGLKRVKSKAAFNLTDKWMQLELTDLNILTASDPHVELYFMLVNENNSDDYSYVNIQGNSAGNFAHRTGGSNDSASTGYSSSWTKIRIRHSSSTGKIYLETYASDSWTIQKEATIGWTDITSCKIHIFGNSWGGGVSGTYYLSVDNFASNIPFDDDIPDGAVLTWDAANSRIKFVAP
jgi:hypothetical protein